MKAFRLRLMSQALPFLLASPGLVAIPALAYAQQAPSAAEAQAALNPPAAQTYSQAQLDQMLAPVALYPDQVLMQVLMAATFPQQVIDAGQWLQDPNNAQIHGDALVAALQPLPWDPSVKSLVAFPQIIVMMNEHMDWTQGLGVAFGSQQVMVMGEVQTLRNRAAAANQFHNNSQIRYVHSSGVWVIEPVHPNEIYIPVYNPAVVYGHWAYPEYPPVYVPPPPGFVSAGFNLGPGIAFSVGFGVVAPLWGWGHPDWRRHEMVINQTRYTHITTTNHFEENHVVIQGGAWRRTAPVVTVEAPHRAAPAAGPRPEGTAAPSTIHAPPPHPGGPGEARPAQAPGEARPGEARPGEARPGEARPGEARPGEARPGETRPGEAHPGEAHPGPGQPPHPEEAHPAPAAPAHPGEPAHPGPEGARPGQPSHPEEAHPAPGTPPHPGQPVHPEEAHPAPGTPSHPGEPPHPAPENAHPGNQPHPEGARPGEPPHPEPQHAAPPAEHAAPSAPHPEERAAPPHPAEAPHPAPEAAHPAEPPHPAPPPHPAEPPHPAAAPPAPHPAPPPQAAHPAEPPHPEAGKPPEPPK